jgi:hypothetical protein
MKWSVLSLAAMWGTAVHAQNANYYVQTAINYLQQARSQAQYQNFYAADQSLANADRYARALGYDLQATQAVREISKARAVVTNNHLSGYEKANYAVQYIDNAVWYLRQVDDHCPTPNPYPNPNPNPYPNPYPNPAPVHFWDCYARGAMHSELYLGRAQYRPSAETKAFVACRQYHKNCVSAGCVYR